MKTYWKSALVFLFAAAASTQASVLYYWDFNNTSTPTSQLVPTVGNASATLIFSAIGLGDVTNGPGTTANLVSGYTAGRSLEFLDTFDGFSNHVLEFRNLDFSNQTDVQFSFAARSTEIFEIGETFTYRYRASASDSWSQAFTWNLPTSTWEVKSFSLPTLAGATAAQIEIRSTAIFQAGSVLEFDNVQITAVPEPGTVILLTIAGAVVVILSRRRCTV